MKRQHLPLVYIAIFVAVVFGVSANADGLREVATKAQTAYSAAQVKWQNDLAELVTRTNPEFKDIANIQRNLQLAYIEERTRQIRFLLENDPHRIIVTKELSQFTNFEWTEEDAKELIQADPSYATLRNNISSLREKNDQQPDWPKFRAWFRDSLSKSKEYKTILSNFIAKQKKVEVLLQQYKPE